MTVAGGPEGGVYVCIVVRKARTRFTYVLFFDNMSYGMYGHMDYSSRLRLSQSRKAHALGLPVTFRWGNTVIPGGRLTAGIPREPHHTFNLC